VCPMLLGLVCKLFGHSPRRKTYFDYDRQLIIGECKWCKAEMTRRMRVGWDLNKP
jgi:hypothetical protein